MADTATEKLCRRMGLILGLSCIFPAHAANLPDAQELMQVLGIDRKELLSLDQGKIVPFAIAEGDEKELAAGAVIYLPAAPTNIIQFINDKGMAAIDSEVIAQGAIPVQAALDAFKGFALKAGTDGAKEFLRQSPEVNSICRRKNFRVFGIPVQHSLMQHRKSIGKFYLSVG